MRSGDVLFRPVFRPAAVSKSKSPYHYMSGTFQPSVIRRKRNHGFRAHEHQGAVAADLCASRQDHCPVGLRPAPRPGQLKPSLQVPSWTRSREQPFPRCSPAGGRMISFAR